MLSDPFYTFAFESIYISCQGFIKEQWASFPFIRAYVMFTSLTSFLWGPTWFRKVSGYQLFQCPVLGGSQQWNPTKSKTKWMKWPLEHTHKKSGVFLSLNKATLQACWKTSVCTCSKCNDCGQNMKTKQIFAFWCKTNPISVTESRSRAIVFTSSAIVGMFCLYISDRLLT